MKLFTYLIEGNHDLSLTSSIAFYQHIFQKYLSTAQRFLSFHASVLIALAFLFTGFSANAQTTHTTIKAGNFTDATVWASGSVPSNGTANHVVINHAVNFDVSEFWLGGQNGNSNTSRTLTINSGGSLKGSGKLIVRNNKSKIKNDGVIELTNNFSIGANDNDSAYFENNGTAYFSFSESLKNVSIQNNGTLTFKTNNNALVKSLVRNMVGKSITFVNYVHLNEGSVILNHGAITISNTNDAALNFNSGQLHNYGTVTIAGGTNMASGNSIDNLLYNYGGGVYRTSKVKTNNKSRIENAGDFYCTNDFENTGGGVVINHPCAYIEQSSNSNTFKSENSNTLLTNNGFILVKGNFLNTSQALLNGSGTLHIKGTSTNSDQAKIEGTLCIYDPSATSANILDKPTRNNATVEASVTRCASGAVPICDATGGYGSQVCKTTDPCFEFSYNGYVRNSNNTVTLSFSIKTNCDNALSNAAFQLPAKAKAGSPQNSNPSFNYTIENTTNNPFYAVKFEANPAEGYKNGASDTFTYTLTEAQFNSLTTIQVQAKAGQSVGTVTFDVGGCCTNQVAITGPATVCVNAPHTYSVPAVQGSTYAWTVPNGWVITAGQGTNEITVTPSSLAGEVKVKQGMSTCGTLMVNMAMAPAITTQPQAVLTHNMNSAATFNVVATGFGITYQWQVQNGSNGSWTNLTNTGIYSGVNTATLSLSKVTSSENNLNYRCLVSGCAQQVVSSVANLQVGLSMAVNLKVMLEGPYNVSTGLMNNTLNTAGLLPVSQPYNFGSYGYAGTETVPQNFFSQNPDIIDWVLVEIRTELDPRQLVSRKACLLRKDGFIVALDGVSKPDFLNVTAGNYFVVVIHRNHVPIISKKPVNLSALTPLYDFSIALDQASGIFPQKEMPTKKFALFAGDANGSGSVSTADWNECWIRDYLKTGYLLSDFNMDGVVNDVDYYTLWLKNNGKVTQVPR